MIRLTLQSHASPEDILSRIRTHVPQWRRSEIPEWLPRAGIVSIECRVRNSRFRVWYARRWYTGPLAWLTLRGTVLPEHGGTARIELAVGYWPRWYAALPVIFVFGVLILAAATGPMSWWWLAALAWCLTLPVWMYWDAHAGLTRRSEPQADYLVRRVEAIVAEAPSSAPDATLASTDR